jgi:NADPH-dependent 2,4-dienoyl-CoA reductase/sulfur reductase-like enzyme
VTAVEHLGCDVVVVGAGPAGLAAATASAASGTRTIVLDAFRAAGGQYLMQPPGGLGASGSQATVGRQRIAAAEAAGALFRTGAEVFWAERRSGGIRLHAAVAGGSGLVVDAASLVVATGAMERAVPFKGWTLPGVIGAGAAQRLLKTGGIAPGKRVVLAGSGPFLLAVAKTFADTGAPLSHVIEACRPTARVLAPFTVMPGRLAEAAHLVAGLVRTGAHRRFGWAVVEALGTTGVEAVRIAPLAADGTADLAAAQTVEGIDTLCVGYGFRPVVDLTGLLKAAHDYDDRAGGWFCRVDPETQQTDVAGVFAAGETTGVAGWLAASLSGSVAGLAASAHAKGRPVAADAGMLDRLRTVRRFADALAKAWPFPHALAAQLSAEAVVCRCEDVTAAAIRAAVDDGARTVGAVKMWTRAGMGPCQGRVCGPAVAAMVAAQTGGAVAGAGLNPTHLPLRPVPIEVVEACLSQP